MADKPSKSYSPTIWTLNYGSLQLKAVKYISRKQKKTIVKTLDELAPLKVVNPKERLPAHVWGICIREGIAERNTKKQRAWKLRHSDLSDLWWRQYEGNACKNQFAKNKMKTKKSCLPNFSKIQKTTGNVRVCGPYKGQWKNRLWSCPISATTVAN